MSEMASSAFNAPIMHSRGEDWIHNLHPELQDDMDTVVALSGIKEWLSLVRVPTQGKLDVRATAENIGIPVTFIETKGIHRGETFGLPLDEPDDPFGINIVPSYSPESRRRTMGHELGHLYLEALGYRHRVYSEIAEEFCNAVAREVTMPTEEFKRVGQVEEKILIDLATSYGVELGDVIDKLMRTGTLPSKVAVDSGLGAAWDELAGVICRSYVCLDCEDGRDCRPADYEIPVFNFSNDEYWPSLSTCLREPNYLRRPTLHKALTRHYFPQGKQTVLISKWNLRMDQPEGQA